MLEASVVLSYSFRQRAVYDCLPNGEEDPRTLHGGFPPANHTKIAINIWIRARGRISGRRRSYGESDLRR